MKLTLSFDNGPDPEVTPAVLDVLRDRGVTAQFFVLGKQLGDPRCRRLVERARDAGHLVGNHSFSHTVPLGWDKRPDWNHHASQPESLPPARPGSSTGSQ